MGIVATIATQYRSGTQNGVYFRVGHQDLELLTIMDRALSRYKLGGITKYADTWVIGDSLYELKFVRKMNEDSLGICDPSAKRLAVKKGQTRIEIFRTFIHEAMHAMEAEGDHDIPHKHIEFLEVWFGDFLLDNAPQLAKIIFS